MLPPTNSTTLQNISGDGHLSSLSYYPNPNWDELSVNDQNNVSNYSSSNGMSNLSSQLGLFYLTPNSTSTFYPISNEKMEFRRVGLWTTLAIAIGFSLITFILSIIALFVRLHGDETLTVIFEPSSSL